MSYFDMTPISSFRLTFWLLGASLLVWLAYDIWVVATGRQGATISEVTLWTMFRWPIAPFAFGVIVGHLMWPQWVTEASVLEVLNSVEPTEDAQDVTGDKP